MSIIKNFKTIGKVLKKKPYEPSNEWKELHEKMEYARSPFRIKAKKRNLKVECREQALVLLKKVRSLILKKRNHEN